MKCQVLALVSVNMRAFNQLHCVHFRNILQLLHNNFLKVALKILHPKQLKKTSRDVLLWQ